MNKSTKDGDWLQTGLEPTRFARCTCFNLRRTARAVTRFYDRMLAPSGLRATQFTILMMTRRKGPVTLTDLADLLVTERTTVSRNVSLLAAQGFVRHESGSDKRQRLVGITPEGVQALEAAVPFWERAQAHMQESIGLDRLNTLLDGLADVTNSVPASEDVDNAQVDPSGS